MRPNWKTLAGIGVSTFFIWWVLRGEDPGEIVRQVSLANPWYFAASVVVGTTGYFVRALRWHVLLQPVAPRTRFRSRFEAIFIGFAVNNVFPARLGELARPLALNRVEPVTVSGALGSLVVERFLDSIVLVTFFFAPMLLPSFPGAAALLGGAVGAVLQTTIGMLAAFLAGLVALLVFPGLLLRLARSASRRLLPGRRGPRAVGALESFLDALRVLRDPRLLTSAVGWSFGFWLWHGWSFWLGMKAFGIELGLDAALFTAAVVGFAVAIPSAPGFFGTFQLGADVALNGVYGASASSTLAFAFGYHLGGFVPVTLLGLYYASRMGFSVVELRGRGAAPPPPAGSGAHPPAGGKSGRDFEVPHRG